MKSGLTRFFEGMAFFCVGCLHAYSQDTTFIPEVDVNFQLNSTYWAYFQAKNDRDGGDPTQLAIGPSFQAHLKPLVKLKDLNSRDSDRSKSRVLVLEGGYRYILAPGEPAENRMEAIATLHIPLVQNFLMTDRNRADLDWKDGGFNWRYRNRLQFERSFTAKGHPLIPYVAAETYYESEYAKWSTTALYAGCLLPVGKHFEFDTYYEHENNTGKSPNKQMNAIGLALYVFFRHK